MKKRTVIVIFLLGFVFRLLLTLVDYSGDVNNHINWAMSGARYGFTGFYERSFFRLYGTAHANYPPLTMILFSLCYRLYSLTGILIWKLNLALPLFPSRLVFIWQEQENILPAFLKVPAILADIGIAFFVYQIVKKTIKKNSNKPIIFASLVLFNPAFFYNSSYWGQIESLPLFFVLGAFYFLIYRKRHILSAVFMTLAILSKQTAVIFIPLYGLIFIRKLPIKKLLGSIVSSLAVFLVVFFPFIGKNNLLTYPFITYWNRIMIAFGSEYLTAHAFNFWGLMYGLGHIPDSRVTLLGLSVRWWSLIYVYLIMLIILYILHKRKYRTDDIFMAGFLIALSIFLFSTRMHERHISNVLPFVLLSCIYDRRIIIFFLFISFFAFLNLYSGWWSPHFEPIIGFFSSPILVNLLIIGLILCFFIFFIRYAYKKNQLS